MFLEVILGVEDQHLGVLNMAQKKPHFFHTALELQTGVNLQEQIELAYHHSVSGTDLI